MRLIACEAGYAHIIGPCPNCGYAQGGLLMGTVAKDYKGRVNTACMDCDMTVDYYIDSKEEKLFKLESVEIKGFPSKSPQVNTKEPKKMDINSIARETKKMDTEVRGEVSIFG